MEPKKTMKTLTEVLKACRALRSLSSSLPTHHNNNNVPSAGGNSMNGQAAAALPAETAQLLLAVLRYAMTSGVAQLHEALLCASDDAHEAAVNGDVDQLRRYLPIRGWLQYIDWYVMSAEDTQSAGEHSHHHGSSTATGASTQGPHSTSFAGDIVLEDLAQLFLQSPSEDLPPTEVEDSSSIAVEAVGEGRCLCSRFQGFLRVWCYVGLVKYGCRTWCERAALGGVSGNPLRALCTLCFSTIPRLRPVSRPLQDHSTRGVTGCGGDDNPSAVRQSRGIRTASVGQRAEVAVSSVRRRPLHHRYHRHRPAVTIHEKSTFTLRTPRCVAPSAAAARESVHGRH